VASLPASSKGSRWPKDSRAKLVSRSKVCTPRSGFQRMLLVALSRPDSPAEHALQLMSLRLSPISSSAGCSRSHWSLLNRPVLFGRFSVEWADDDFSLRRCTFLWLKINRLRVAGRGRAEAVPRDRRSGLRCTAVSQRAATGDHLCCDKQCDAFRNHRDRPTTRQPRYDFGPCAGTPVHSKSRVAQCRSS
jgi:hypothetical protein